MMTKWIAPKNSKELQVRYGDFIANVIKAHNKVNNYFEDIYQYVWVKLLEVDFLDHFRNFANRQIPNKLTGIAACDFLGVAWDDWYQAMVDDVEWMPVSVNSEPRTSKLAEFVFTDIIQLTLIENCFPVGRDVRNGEVFGEDRPEGFLKFPGSNGNPGMFKHYLERSVVNHYRNYCRTHSRRHRERPVKISSNTGSPQNCFLENSLPDLKRIDAESSASFNEVRELLCETIAEGFGGDYFESLEHQVEIFDSLESGESLIRALKNSSLPPKIRRYVLSTIRPLAENFKS